MDVGMYDRTDMFLNKVCNWTDPRAFRSKSILITGDRTLSGPDSALTAKTLTNLTCRFAGNLSISLPPEFKSLEDELASICDNVGVAVSHEPVSRPDIVASVGNTGTAENITDCNARLSISSDGWIAHLECNGDVPTSKHFEFNPVGAMGAGCLGAAWIFGRCLEMCGSVVQKVVHPLSRGLDRLRVSMRSGNGGVWVWSRRRRKYVSRENPDRVSLDTRQVRWILREKHRGELTNAQIAESMKVSARWVKKLWSRYRHKPVNDVVHPPRMGRRVVSMYGRREHSAVLHARGGEHVGASLLQEKIRERCGLNIPLGVIHGIMVGEGLAREEPGKKKKRHKWIRYERTHSNSLWHTDWKQIHGGMHDGRWFLCYEDDASRFVTGYEIFDNATTENALRVLDEAIRNHGRPASVMTDHGAQFYANEKEAKKRGESKFEKRLVELGIRQILAGVGHPQTNGKIERLHGEIQRKLHEFESIMMRKSDPMDLFMQWYNYRRTHMSLNDGETPAEAFERKMAPKGERIIDEQTGEEYDAS